ncbi:MAG: prepilin-type N-terminal cleavage/methylation domain-containing protein [Sideroxydans sp.]|jgi:prepilin-type N-terminal cleavage/methylation domain-containing protein
MNPNLNFLRIHGFTLVEMAMVLMIVGLLLGGLVPTISAQMETQRISETRRQMNEIRDALLGYAVINGRLPCPAQATLATGGSNAGREATTGNSCACQSGGTNTIATTSGVACAYTSITGVLPWATLGISESDAWSRRYTYRVTSSFADQIGATATECSPTIPAPTASSFALCSAGTPDVRVVSGGNFVAENVPVVFISHGKNGKGAYVGDGTQLAVSTDVDELENSDNNLSFVSHEFTPEFDDLVGWISPGVLMSRMVAAGKLP